MSTFMFRNNNLTSAQVWLEAFMLKESKKEQRIVQKALNANVDAQNFVSLQKNQIIFTKEDAGKSVAETQKIQQVHHELDTLPIAPNFAYC